jgi:hypothetical protein
LPDHAEVLASQSLLFHIQGSTAIEDEPPSIEKLVNGIAFFAKNATNRL